MYVWCILAILFFGLSVSVLAEFTGRSKFFSSPGKLSKFHEGSDAELGWTYNVMPIPPYGSTIFQVLFGVWDVPGYVSKRMISVQKNGRVYKRPGLGSKVDWSGDITNCTCSAQVRINNLTRKDDGYYGIEIELGLHRAPLTYWLRLMVLVSAKIISYTKNVTAVEGNSTAIRCKAEGNPTPKVEIRRHNKTLTNGSGLGEIVYHIRDIKMSDKGEYACVASSDASVSHDRRLVLLQVEPNPHVNDGGNAPPGMKDGGGWNIVPIILIVVCVVCVMVCVIGGIIYIRKRRTLPKPDELLKDGKEQATAEA